MIRRKDLKTLISELFRVGRSDYRGPRDPPTRRLQTIDDMAFLQSRYFFLCSLFFPLSFGAPR